MLCYDYYVLSKIKWLFGRFFQRQIRAPARGPYFPLSVCLAMVVLSSCLKQCTTAPDFQYHWRTKDVKLHHIIFADDVFMFCRGALGSVSTLMKGLNDFSKYSGLYANSAKSLCFFVNVRDDIADAITKLTGFQRGSLPICFFC